MRFRGAMVGTGVPRATVAAIAPLPRGSAALPGIASSANWAGVVSAQKIFERADTNYSPAANFSGRKKFCRDVILDCAGRDAQHLRGLANADGDLVSLFHAYRVAPRHA